MLRCEGAAGYDPDMVSRETAVKPVGESLTQQQFAEECDINVIVDRFALTGRLPDAVQVPQFADVTGLQMDYQTAMNFVIEAKAGFMSMPADVRAKFNHDPAVFMAFVDDPANAKELVSMGLAIERKPIDAAPVAADPPNGASLKASGPAST